MCSQGANITEIVVKPFPLELKTKQIIEYFKFFGDVKEVRILNTTPAQCFIKFHESWSVVMAAEKRFHKIGNESFIVEAVQIFKEPSKIEQNIQILSRNEDCLLKIFDYLNLRDQLHLSQSHPRFAKTLGDIFRSQKKQKSVLDNFNLYSISEFREYLKTAGSFLKTVQISKNYGKPEMTKTYLILNFVAEFDRNIENLQIMKGFDMRTRLLSSLNMNSLIKIELYDCDLKDLDLNPLNKAKKLEALGLAKNPNLEGLELSNFTKLQRLSLYECPNIKPIVLVSMWQSLKYLDIRGTTLHEHYSFVENCVPPALETLKMVVRFESEPRLNVYFPNLKCLHIEFGEKAQFSSFIEQHAEKFKVLNLKGTYSKKKPLNIKLDSLKNLRSLRISLNSTDPFNENIISLNSSLHKLVELKLQINNNCHNWPAYFKLIEKCPKLKRLCFGGPTKFSNICLLNVYRNRKQAAAGNQLPLLVLFGHENICKMVDRSYPCEISEFNAQINIMKVLTHKSDTIDVLDVELDGVLDENFAVEEFERNNYADFNVYKMSTKTNLIIFYKVCSLFKHVHKISFHNFFIKSCRHSNLNDLYQNITFKIS